MKVNKNMSVKRLNEELNLPNWVNFAIDTVDRYGRYTEHGDNEDYCRGYIDCIEDFEDTLKQTYLAYKQRGSI